MNEKIASICRTVDGRLIRQLSPRDILLLLVVSGPCHKPKLEEPPTKLRSAIMVIHTTARNTQDKDGTRGSINKRMPIVHRCKRIPNIVLGVRW